VFLSPGEIPAQDIHQGHATANDPHIKPPKNPMVNPHVNVHKILLRLAFTPICDCAGRRSYLAPEWTTSRERQYGYKAYLASGAQVSRS
jgi:hypothetical protein